MVISTSVILGTRETPHFVSYEFYDAVKFLCAINSVDVSFKPNTIRYYVPAHCVIERLYPEFQEYFIEIDDAHLQPACARRNRLNRQIWKHKTPSSVFDRISIYTYETQPHYFLLLPNSSYYHTAIYTDQSISHLIIHGVAFQVKFSRVFVDPHDTKHSVWFSGKPKYQIEIIANQDLRSNPRLLRRAISMIIPRSFKLETMFGNPL